jgi:NAD(P)H dehydrogenase (quinone)
MFRSSFVFRQASVSPKVLCLFYSTYGHNFHMSRAAAEGVRQVTGAEAVVKRVPETLPESVLALMHATEAQKAFADVPIATPNELANYDAIIFSTPTRFGMMAGQMKSFLDATGGLWAQSKLVGKVGSVTTSSAQQHSGQESTILSFHTVLLHQGMIIVSLPLSAYPAMNEVNTVIGGGLYGASVVVGGDGSRAAGEVELGAARAQGKHVAEIARKLLLGSQQK